MIYLYTHHIDCIVTVLQASNYEKLQRILRYEAAIKEREVICAQNRKLVHQQYIAFRFAKKVCVLVYLYSFITSCVDFLEHVISNPQAFEDRVEALLIDNEKWRHSANVNATTSSSSVSVYISKLLSLGGYDSHYGFVLVLMNSGDYIIFYKYTKKHYIFYVSLAV